MAAATDADPDKIAVQALSVDVDFACDAMIAPDRDLIEAWVGNALSASGRMPAGAVEVAVRVVTDDEIRQLNAEYRQQDRSTNVLAFPAGRFDGLPAGVPEHLGDIVICADVVASEAEQQRKTLGAHWAHMLVHATLHLLGFDHRDAGEATEMERLETRILAAGGIADPYTSRW